MDETIFAKLIHAETTKLAGPWEDVGHTVIPRLFKARQSSKAPYHMGDPKGYFAFSCHTDDASRATGQDPEFIRGLVKDLKEKYDAGPGTVFAPKKGRAMRSFYNLEVEGADSSLPLSQHRMLDRIVRNHEIDETVVKPSQSMVKPWGGHFSPDVIFRENNMVHSLSDDYAPVKNIMKNLRNKGRGRETETIQETFPWFRYGDQRLSRGMRRRMTEIMDRRSREEAEKLQLARSQALAKNMERFRS